MEADFENLFRSSTSKWWQFTVVLFITLVLCLGSYTQSAIFKKADNFFYDFLLQTTATGNVSSQVTIIDIDETSLSAVGQWPWPRYLLAKLVKELSANQPAAMGLDIVFPEPDRSSLKNIQLQFQKDFALNLGFTGIPPAMQDNDLYLAHIFRQADIVGARYFYFDHFNKKPIPLRITFNVVDKSGRLKANQAEGVLTNIPQIEKALNYTGFLNNKSDTDGLLRSTPLLISFKDQTFTNLSLSTFLKAHQIKEVEVLEDFFGLYIKADKYKIPITRDGYIHIRFTGPGRAHKFISAVDILNQNFSPADIQGKILFIGSSATGLNDIHHTVFDPGYPGVEIHAAILNSIYENCQVIKPIWSNAFITGVCIFTGILMMLLLFFSSSPILLLTGTFVWGGILLISYLLFFIKMSVFVSPVSPLVLTVFTFVFTSFVRFTAARKASFTWFKKLSQAQQVTIETIVSLVETRDPETGQHIVRTQNYARALAVHLKESGLFPDILTDNYIETLYLASPLHDIGKVGIPDKILLKPGKLTDEEFGIMKTHSSLGRDTLERIGRTDPDNYFLMMGAQIAGSHHERWDGKGYPDGLCGENIPLCGSIMAICDVYDALISERCYKTAFSHEKAMNIILEGRKTLFDPKLVDGFFAIENTIKSIAAKHKDLMPVDTKFSFSKGFALVPFIALILVVMLMTTAPVRAAQTYSRSDLVRFQNRIIDYRSRINPRFKKRGRPGTRLIIVHTSELGLKSTLRVVSRGKQFKNGCTTPGGHANYVIARNGTVYRILDKKYRADHAGLSMWNGVSDVSDISVGIEFVGYHYAPLTVSQYTSAGMLLFILKRVYGLGDKDILTHSQIAYGKPNRWFFENHRGRKRCAKNFDRTRAGLAPTWSFDPDVRAGRLTPDPMLAQVFYPAPGAVVSIGKKASQPQESDVISKQNSAWAIAGEDYDAPNTVYILPGGKTLAGDRVASSLGWERLPEGTKVLLNQETEQVREQAKNIIKTISRQMTAWSHAGGAYHAASTIYFLPSGRILTGYTISDWDDLPSGTRLVVGYKGPVFITKNKTAYGIAGANFKNPGTIYHIPGRGPVQGNRIPDFSDLPKGTGVYLPIAG